ncbi:MAG: signal peptidase I [Clostridia bacterium]|nr:signal peptidase I [Clostridia bacterium]
MKRLGTYFKKAADILLVVLVTVLVCITVVTLVSRISGNGQTLVCGIGFGRVVTGSMEPEIPTGSFILVKETPTAELAVKDVIMFLSDDPSVPDGVPVTHRIEAIHTDEQGQRLFTTKGDANAIADPYPAREACVIGRVVWHSPFLGKLVEWIHKPIVFPVLIAILLVDLAFNVVIVSSQAKALKEEQSDK